MRRTGTGRLFLAFEKSPEFQQSFATRVRPNLDSFARKILAQEVEFAKRHRFSYNDEDTALGYRSVSVPVFKFGDQIIATLYVSAASSQLSLRGLIEAAVPKLHKASVRLSSILGASRELLAEQGIERCRRRLRPAVESLRSNSVLTSIVITCGLAPLSKGRELQFLTVRKRALVRLRLERRNPPWRSPATPDVKIGPREKGARSIDGGLPATISATRRPVTPPLIMPWWPCPKGKHSIA